MFSQSLQDHRINRFTLRARQNWQADRAAGLIINLSAVTRNVLSVDNAVRGVPQVDETALQEVATDARDRSEGQEPFCWRCYIRRANRQFIYPMALRDIRVLPSW